MITFSVVQPHLMRAIDFAKKWKATPETQTPDEKLRVMDELAGVMGRSIEMKENPNEVWKDLEFAASMIDSRKVLLYSSFSHEKEALRHLFLKEDNSLDIESLIDILKEVKDDSLEHILILLIKDAHMYESYSKHMMDRLKQMGPPVNGKFKKLPPSKESIRVLKKSSKAREEALKIIDGIAI